MRRIFFTLRGLWMRRGCCGGNQRFEGKWDVKRRLSGRVEAPFAFTGKEALLEFHLSTAALKRRL